MSKQWYPIIDYDACTGCLRCVDFCPHGVFSARGGKPFVADPGACVDFCKGCQKGACDFEAISFFGDQKADRRASHG